MITQTNRQKYLHDYHHNRYISKRQEINNQCKLYKRIYRATIHGKYLTYVHSNNQRKISFTLSKIDFALIISTPCYYCGDLQENFNGIDRINPNIGYTLKNSVSCCTMCNYMKNHFKLESFIERCKKITEKQLIKGD